MDVAYTKPACLPDGGVTWHSNRCGFGEAFCALVTQRDMSSSDNVNDTEGEAAMFLSRHGQLRL